MDKIILKERINKFDNIKGLAIILIVVGHLLITNDFSLKLLKNFLFIIHLPLFFFVSGYFSKIGPGELLKSFKRIMIPYIIFCILFKIYFYIPYFQLSYYPIFIYPEYGLWFLLSIFTMKMILPLFNKLKYPISFSIILAMIIGFININPGLLAITKTICYMPIFLMGFTYKKHEEIVTILNRVTEYKRKTKQPFVNLEERLSKAPIVKRLKEYVNANPYQKASQADFAELRSLLNEELPHFYTTLNTPHYTLSEIEYDVSMLLRVRFSPMDIHRLTGMSPGYVSNMRSRLLLRVYGVDGIAPAIDCVGGGGREPKIIMRGTAIT